jgi:hypothetical protein
MRHVLLRRVRPALAPISARYDPLIKRGGAPFSNFPAPSFHQQRAFGMIDPCITTHPAAESVLFMAASVFPCISPGEAVSACYLAQNASVTVDVGIVTSTTSTDDSGIPIPQCGYAVLRGWEKTSCSLVLSRQVAQMFKPSGPPRLVLVCGQLCAEGGCYPVFSRSAKEDFASLNQTRVLACVASLVQSPIDYTSI